MKMMRFTLLAPTNTNEAQSSEACVISDDEDVRSKKKSLWDSFEEDLKKKKASHQSTTQLNKDEHELALYLSAPYIDRKANPLNWWKLNKGQFPILSQLARDYLAIPAMSTPSKWLLDTSVIN